jgi:hypothetical protein
MVRRFKVEGGVSSINTRLKSIIDEQSLAKSLEHKKVRSSLYASDFGQCQRKVYFSHFPDQFPPDEQIDARTARVFANGEDVHTRLGGYLKRVPEIDFRDEVDVPRDELDVHGRCDGILRIDGQGIVAEFKSINKADVEEPKLEHIGQLMWYLGMFTKLRKDLLEDFGFDKDATVHEDDLIHGESLSGRTFETLTPAEKWVLTTHGPIDGELIYESKQTQHTFNFPVAFDEERFKATKLWFEQMKHYVEAKQIPGVKYNSSRFPCRWGGYKTSPAGQCQFWEKCWGAGGLEAQNGKIDPE